MAFFWIKNRGVYSQKTLHSFPYRDVFQVGLVFRVSTFSLYIGLCNLPIKFNPYCHFGTGCSSIWTFFFKSWGPPLWLLKNFAMNICNIGIIESFLVGRFHKCRKFCSSMSTAQEVMKEHLRYPDLALRQFFCLCFMISQQCVGSRSARSRIFRAQRSGCFKYDGFNEFLLIFSVFYSFEV